MEEEGFSIIELWGQELAPGGKLTVVDVENEPPVFHMVHVTGCALGEGPKPGPHVLKALYQGRPIVLATLEKGVASQCALDFGISSSTTFINAGPSPIFISGYITRSVQPIEGSDDEEDEDEEGETSSEPEDSDGEPPDAIPLRRGAAQLNGLAKKKRAFLDGEADEDMGDGDDSSEEDEGESSDEEDEDEEGDEFDRRPGAKAFGRGAKGGGGGSSSSEGEEDEGESDYEEEEEGAGLPQLDSDDLIAEADSDDEEDDESDEDAPPEEHKSKAKRTIPISTPQPAKKAKQEDAKAPASAPPKVQQKAATGGGKQQKGGSPEDQWLSDMVTFVKQQGKPVPIAALGTHVKRPDGVKAKLKAFILAHADRLALDEQAQTVTARK